jgi:acyl carrier protein
MAPPIEQINAVIHDLLREQTRDWGLDVDELGPDTTLIEQLCYSSMDLMELMGKIEVQFQRKLPFDKLIADPAGGYRTELSIRDLSEFVRTNFDAPAPAIEPV